MLLIPVASREKNSSAVTHLIGKMMFEFAVQGSRAANGSGMVGALDVAGGRWLPHGSPSVGVPGLFLLPGSHRRCSSPVPTEVPSESWGHRR